MMAKALRIAGAGLLGLVCVLWARALAHSRKPPPEGQWREIDPEEP